MAQTDTLAAHRAQSLPVVKLAPQPGGEMLAGDGPATPCAAPRGY
jgi:hypothetical protein